MTWTWVVILAVVGYAQRSAPWIMAARVTLPPKVEEWLQYVAPAAFATLLVTDIANISVAAIISLTVAAIVSWRTQNLGLAVLAALGISLASQALAIALP